jgi:limonene-1,2-epoxide hydrolase
MREGSHRDKHDIATSIRRDKHPVATSIPSRQASRRDKHSVATAGVKSSYRDITIDVHSLIVSGANVAAEVTISGTMLKPDGTTRNIRVRGASFFVVRNGLIEKWTDYFDAQTFLEQTR